MLNMFNVNNKDIKMTSFDVGLSSDDVYMFKVNNGKTRTPELRHQNDANEIVLVSLLLTLNRFHTFFWCFHC